MQCVRALAQHRADDAAEVADLAHLGGQKVRSADAADHQHKVCLLYTSPSPRDRG